MSTDIRNMTKIYIAVVRCRVKVLNLDLGCPAIPQIKLCSIRVNTNDMPYDIAKNLSHLRRIYVVRHTPQKEKNDTRVDGRHIHTK
jgi:hypothetical protein